MEKDLSKLPNIAPELVDAFNKIIGTGIKVFAKENGMSIEDAERLFEEKLKDIPIKTFDESKITKDSPEEEKQLRFKRGCTPISIEFEKDAKKSIYINKYLLETPGELQSTLIHEIYHLVLSDDRVSFKMGNQHVYNLGSNEFLFEDKKLVKEIGKKLHEASVTRMQKKVCKKEGIKFIEKGPFASSYIKDVEMLDKYEKACGRKIRPIETMRELRIFHENSIEEFVEFLDNGEYDKCEEFINKTKDNTIEQVYGKAILKVVQTGRKIKDNISTNFKKMRSGKKEVLMLDDGEGTQKIRNEFEEFENRISNNGELKRIKPLMKSEQINDKGKSIKKENEGIDFE